MTRSAWVTVRLPGTSTAPATSTRTRFQAGAVKQGRNTESQVARTGGTKNGSGAAVAPGLFDAIAVVESGRTDSAGVPAGRDNGRPDGLTCLTRAIRSSSASRPTAAAEVRYPPNAGTVAT